jgi:hypothetical protein
VNYDSVEVPRHLLEELVKCLEGGGKRAVLPGSAAYYSRQVAAGYSSRGDHERLEDLAGETKPGGIPVLENDLANLSRSQSSPFPMRDPRTGVYAEQADAGYSSRGHYEPPHGLLGETRPGGIPVLENDLANLSRSQSSPFPMRDPRTGVYAEQADAGYSSRGDYGPLESRPGATKPGQIPALENDLTNLSTE